MDFIFDPSLVLYLPLYELDGASFMSRDAYGHICTVTGALWRPNGRYFDGTDDLISLPQTPILNPVPRTGLTIEAWIKREVTGVEHPIADRGWGNPYWFRVLADNTLSIGLYLETIGYFTKATTDTIGTGETYVAITFNSGSGIIALYINGSLSKDFSGYQYLLMSVSNTLRIGESESGKHFKGIIGEVRIYNRALTPLEIQHIYLATKWRYR